MASSALCRLANVPYINYSQLPEFLNNGPQSFVDISHLNDSSAVLFSKLLSREIKALK